LGPVHEYVAPVTLGPVSCKVVPAHIAPLLLTDGVDGIVFTVIVTVWEHPLVFVYVTIAVPAETPVTKPLLSTVAIAIFDDTHGFEAAAVADPVNAVVNPTQTDNVPFIVGKGLI
jgi:hypothetical protein